MEIPRPTASLQPRPPHIPARPPATAERAGAPGPARRGGTGSAFAAWGRLVHRRRAIVLLVSLLVMAGSLVVLSQGADLQPYEPPLNTESGRAAQLIGHELPTSRDSSFILVLSHPSLDANDTAFRTAVDEALEPLRTSPRVEAVRTPYDASAREAAAMTSTDGHRILAVVYLSANYSAEASFTELRPLVRSDQLEILATDQIAIFHDVEKQLEKDLVLAETVSLPTSLLLLLLVFGTLAAALLPVGVGAFAVMGGLAATFALAHVMDVSVYAVNVVSLIGLGVAIDYSLFVVSRYREELRQGNGADALARTMATAGRAVVFSGLTVGIGLAGLAFYQGMYVVTMGLGGALVVASAVFYALTLLPAVLAFLGPRINRLRVPFRRPERAPDAESGAWHRIAHAVMRRPVLFLVPALAFILLLGLPFLQINLANGGVDQLPKSAESRRGFEIMQEAFPSRGATVVSVVVEFPGGDVLSAERVRGLYEFTRRAAAIGHVLGVDSVVDLDPSMGPEDYVSLYGQDPAAWPPSVREAVGATIGARVALVQVHLDVFSTTDAARDVVRALRADRDVADGRTLVTGSPAFDLDAQKLIARNTPAAMAFVVLATYALLFLQTRSIALPAKAIVMNFLSITASFGAVVWIFQMGHLSGLLGFTPASIDPSIPVLLFCIVFGLSMDYEVLLLSRMHEEYLATGDNRKAVAMGLEKSGRLITSAAAIMFLVFASFGLAQVTIIKAFGIGLAIAVAMDATIVRAIIVPATMRLMGEWNWWGPGHWGRGRRPAPTRAQAAAPSRPVQVPPLPRPR